MFHRILYFDFCSLRPLDQDSSSGDSEIMSVDVSSGDRDRAVDNVDMLSMQPCE